MNKDTARHQNLQWARVLVRSGGKKLLGSPQVVLGATWFSCGGRPRLVISG